MKNLTLSEYLAYPALSRSDIKAFIKSPKYFKWYRDEDRGTKAKSFGSALHCLALEPHLFKEQFAVKPEGLSLATKDGKAWKESAGERQILSYDEYNQLSQMSANVRLNPILSKWIDPDSIEKTFFWNHDGIDLKCRPDVFNKRYGLALDLKTTSKPLILRQLSYQIRNYGYDLQAAMCIDGLNSYFGKGFDAFIMVFLEKTPPFDLMLITLKKEDIQRARIEYQTALAEYKICKADDKWPSRIDSEIQVADLTFLDMEGGPGEEETDLY